eukprot:scaffold23021_cov135-Isochrysis_galbana.AAC.3
MGRAGRDRSRPSGSRTPRPVKEALNAQHSAAWQAARCASQTTTNRESPASLAESCEPRGLKEREQPSILPHHRCRSPPAAFATSLARTPLILSIALPRLAEACPQCALPVIRDQSSYRGERQERHQQQVRGPLDGPHQGGRVQATPAGRHRAGRLREQRRGRHRRSSWRRNRPRGCYGCGEGEKREAERSGWAEHDGQSPDPHQRVALHVADVHQNLPVPDQPSDRRHWPPHGQQWRRAASPLRNGAKAEAHRDNGGAHQVLDASDRLQVDRVQVGQQRVGQDPQPHQRRIDQAKQDQVQRIGPFEHELHSRRSDLSRDQRPAGFGLRCVYALAEVVVVVDEH